MAPIASARNVWKNKEIVEIGDRLKRYHIILLLIVIKIIGDHSLEIVAIRVGEMRRGLFSWVLMNYQEERICKKRKKDLFIQTYMNTRIAKELDN
jgi:hypothetical protein